MADGYYRTGDEARRDDDGYVHFVGRGDDVFKSSDYRISPFELESVLLEHELVAEAAVVPSPDPVRLVVPKAFVVLVPGTPETQETARAIFDVLQGEARAVQARAPARVRARCRRRSRGRSAASSCESWRPRAARRASVANASGGSRSCATGEPSRAWVLVAFGARA